MNLPAPVREFLVRELQQVCHLKVDVIAGDANAAATSTTFKKLPRYSQFFNCHDAKKDAL